MQIKNYSQFHGGKMFYFNQGKMEFNHYDLYHHSSQTPAFVYSGCCGCNPVSALTISSPWACYYELSEFQFYSSMKWR